MTVRTRRISQGIALIIVISMMLLASDNFVSPGMRTLITGAAIVVLIVTSLDSLRNAHLLVSPLDFGWLPYVLLTGLTVLLSASPRRSLEPWLWPIALQLLVAYGALYLFQRWKERLLYRVLLLAGGYLYCQAFQSTFTYVLEAIGDRAEGLMPPAFRLYGILDHPNVLAMFTAVVMPCLAAYWLVKTNRLERIAVGLWLAGAALALYGTASRSGLVATVVGVFVALLLAAVARSDRPQARWRAWVEAHRARAAALLLAGAVLVVAALGFLVYLQTGRLGHDSGLGRLSFYNSAIRMFAAHPLAGDGPGGFARNEVLTHSVPPYQPLPHAHNVVLGTAAESGILGLIGLLALIVVAVWTCVSAWRAQPTRRALIAGPIGGLVGFGVAGILDSPTGDFWSFAVATLMLAYIAAGLPVPELRTIRGGWLRTRLISVSLWGVALVLVVSLIPHGVLNAVPNPGQPTVSTTDLLESAQQLDAISTVDPSDGLVVLQSAYNWARVAWASADPRNPALTNAIERFERGIPYDPGLGLHYLNLSTLYMKAGRPLDAVLAARRAIWLAYGDPVAWLNLGLTLEQLGHTSEAQFAYVEALHLEPEWSTAGFWQATPLRQAAYTQYSAQPDNTRRTTDLLAEGDAARASGRTAEAVAAYRQALDRTPGAAGRAFIRGLIALAQDNRAAFAIEMKQATFSDLDDWGPAPDAWLYLGDMAAERGDREEMLRDYAAAYRYFTSRGIGGFGTKGSNDYAITTFRRFARISDYLPGVVTLDITPERAARFKVLAQAMTMEGRAGEAARIYRDILQTNPADVQARATLTTLMAQSIRP
jgi:O-antigen ligase/tetratricopeptide (TPR) repeat protein